MITVTKCEAHGWWQTRADTLWLAATAKGEAEAGGRVNQAVKLYREVMTREPK